MCFLNFKIAKFLLFFVIFLLMANYFFRPLLEIEFLLSLLLEILKTEDVPIFQRRKNKNEKLNFVRK